jgi:hypothetical protein
MKKPPYREGTWFAIPLKESQFAVGRVARHSPKGAIVLAYLFGPKRDAVPALEELGSLKATDAVKVWRVGDLGLLNGNWPIIGDSPTWEREQWPMPNFLRQPDATRSGWKVTYADDDPNRVLEEQRVPSQIEGLERDALFGYSAAESALSQILK